MTDDPTTKPPAPPDNVRTLAARPSHIPHIHIDVAGSDAAVALRALRMAFGRRPPLYAPISGNAIASGTAAVVELRNRLRPLAERDQERPARDIAREVLAAAAPFVQRDMLNRICSDRLWMLGWILIGSFTAAAVMTTALVYAIVAGVHWLAVLLGLALVVHLAAAVQLATSVNRQAGRARTVAARPLTGPGQEDRSADTMDIASARKSETK